MNGVHISDWFVDFPRIDQLETTILKTPFEEDEIHGAIMDTELDKTPRSDGFPFPFVQSFWNLF